jgi:hypothetical protein
VRRASSFRFDAAAQDFSSGGAGRHCVIWGDGDFTSRRFHSKEEANTFFMEKQHSELVAFQYEGSHEVHRYVSKRMKLNDFGNMSKWCGKDSAQAADNNALERETSLLERPSGLIATSNDVTTLSSLESAKSSTMTSKVSLLENEVNALASRAASMLERIGIDGAANNPSRLLTKHNEGAKLKPRLDDLETFVETLHGQARFLETELFGGSSLGNFAKDSGHSFKSKLEVLSSQIDDLKSHLSGLENAPILGEVAKLQERSLQVSTNAARLFRSIIDGSIATSALPEDSKQPLKARLSSLTEYTEHLADDLLKFEHQVLGTNLSSPAIKASQSAGSIKDRAVSLTDLLHDLESRISILANAPIMADVGRMERAANSLSSRLIAVARKVGYDNNWDATQAPMHNKKVTHEADSASKGDLKGRISLLEALFGKVQSNIEALEEQLLGSGSTSEVIDVPLPAQSQLDTLRNKASFMQGLVENMKGRISVLEQQI